MSEPNLIILLLIGSLVGAAAGYIGSLMVLKHMSLVGDALSHVALPGIAIALALQISPMIGALAALTLAVLGVWYFQKTSTVYPEALVGVFFTASLAIGILITPEPDLLEALFGKIETISIPEGLAAAAIALMVMLVGQRIASPMLLGIISEELVQSIGTSLNRINLIYLLLVGTAVALGVKFVGTLLMGALVIIPAASAKNISQSLKQYFLFSILFGLSSATGGILISEILHLSPGPLVVLLSIAIFLTTYLASAAYTKTKW